MKQEIMNARLKFSMLITTLFVSFIAAAQDKKIDININTKSDDSSFFMQPWVWVVGGLVFILLLVALLKNNKSA